VLLGTGFAALSNALALVARKEESLIGAVTFGALLNLARQRRPPAVLTHTVHG
jgi:hypothetical protein